MRDKDISHNHEILHQDKALWHSTILAVGDQHGGLSALIAWQMRKKRLSDVIEIHKSRGILIPSECLIEYREVVKQLKEWGK